VKLEEKAKKLVPSRFHEWIHVFGENISERMPTKKVWDHVIERRICTKKEEGVSLSREEREEVYEFIKEQLRKEYIRLLELSQMAPVFFVGKKDGKKHIVQNF